MRFTNLAILVFASCIVAKNVIYLDDLTAGLKNEKRDARRVMSLEDFKNAVKEGELHFDDKAKRAEQDVLDEKRPLLTSVLPQMPMISIFSGYLRDDDQMLQSLESSDSFTLFVAPLDSAIREFSLAKGLKPWEYPNKVQNDETDDKVIRDNIHAFIEAHASSKITLQDGNLITAILMNGEEISIKRMTSLDNYELTWNEKSIAIGSISPAENGMVFEIPQVLIV